MTLELTDQQRVVLLDRFRHALKKKHQFLLIIADAEKDEDIKGSDITADCSKKCMTMFISQILSSVELPVALEILGGATGLRINYELNLSSDSTAIKVLNSFQLH